ncbi:LTA synthase family protein [Streptococcus caprae]|uniref:LTA synthase family protein n=1 Tax=Streptococcus caprae TaxID=1640501 RepID=A0ABV8CV06_9STRE
MKDKLKYIYLLLLVGFINFLLILFQLKQIAEFESRIDTMLYFSMFVSVFSVTIISVLLSKFDLINILKKILIFYLIDVFYSWFITISKNINNPDFNLLLAFKNHFIQYNIFSVFLLIFLLAYFIKIIKNDKIRFNSIILHNFGDTSKHLEILLLSSIFLNDKLLLNNLLTYFVTQFKNTNLTAFLFLLFFLNLSILLILSYFVRTLLCSWIELKNNQGGANLTFISSLTLATLFNYVIQIPFRYDNDALGNHLFNGAVAFQIIFLFLLYFLIYLIINRYLIGTAVIVFLGITLGVVNSLKLSMRNEPVLVTDIIWLKQLKLLFSFVNQNYLILTVFSILLVINLILVLHKKFLTGKIYESRSIRLIFISLILLSYTFMFSIFARIKDHKINNNIPLLSKLNNGLNLDYLGFKTNATYKSLTYVWTRQLTTKIIEKPENYNEDTIKSIYKKYVEAAGEINKSRSNSISKQTVIFILSESYSNPRKITGTDISYDPTQNINKLMTQTTSGQMKSDGYGGGTANMEFQALTGLPYYNYSSTVSTLYTEVVPRLKKFTSVSEYFENKIVIHPSAASNYNRFNVYNQLNFDRLIFQSGSSEKFKKDEKIGLNTSDQAVYDTILDNIDENEYQFFSVITMQNHAPWSEWSPTELTSFNPTFSEDTNDSLQSYVRLLYHTDIATNDFLESLKQIEQDVTVVFYGDHLPGFYPNYAFNDNPSNQYLTDYFIWSNHQTNKLDYEVVNSSDFIAELFEHTNSKVSPFYALLTDVLKNSSVNQKKLSKNQKIIADDLKMIQYDISLGKGYILKYEDFFSID